MNTNKGGKRFFRSALLFCLAVTSTAFILGCRSVQTRPTGKGEKKVIDGITYHLPRSYLKVSIESKKDAKGNHAELVMGAGPEIVPDKNAKMVLSRSGNELFNRDHAFSFTNGLLSSVHIADEGKTGEVIEDLAAIAFNVISMGATPGPLSAVNAAPPPSPKAFPSDEEKLAALSSIAVGEHVFILPIEGTAGNTALAGTRGLVTFTAATRDLPRDKNSNIEKANIGAAKLKAFNGVAVKLPEPYPVTLALQIDRDVLLNQRIALANTSLEDSTEQKADNDKAIAEVNAKLGATPPPQGPEKAKLDKQLKELTEASAKIDNKIAGAKNAIKLNTKFLGEVTLADRFFPLGEQDYVVMFPDFSPIVKIALNRAPLGKTKYTLSMARGVLTDYHGENPSFVVELVKVPLNITKSLVKLPTEILQLKIDYSSKAKELAAKEAEYLAAQKALKKAGQGPSQDEQDVAALQQQKDILTLQKDIATLKAAIADLEAKKQ